MCMLKHLGVKYGSPFFLFFCFFIYYLFIYLFYLFLAALGVSCSTWDFCLGMWDLLLQHTGSSLQCAGFPLVVACRFSLLQLWHQGSRARGLCSLWHTGSSCGAQAQKLWHVGLLATQRVGSQFPDQGSNPGPLHCKVDSLPLDHQGRP